MARKTDTKSAGKAKKSGKAKATAKARPAKVEPKPATAPAVTAAPAKPAPTRVTATARATPPKTVVARTPAAKAPAQKPAPSRTTSARSAATSRARPAAPRAVPGEAALRKQVIETCLRMNALGINQGTSGNVSVRSGDGFLITPSGVPYEQTAPDQIVRMDLDAGYWGEWLPSSEWRMHHDLFRARPEAGAIVHTHSTYASALSCLRVEVPAFHYMIGVAGGTTLRCASYATFGTQELSDAMLVALEDRTACLLANHGMICFGPTLDKALWLAGEVETLCKQYFIACQAGMPVILGDAEMANVLARFKTYGKQAGELAEGDALAVTPPSRRDA